VFVDREWLAGELAKGKSFEQIGRELGRDGSTIAYWARKHRLRSAGAARFAPRGAPDRPTLEALAAEGATLAEMAKALDRSIATVRHWLQRWEIERTRRPGRTPPDPASAPPVVEMYCARHGLERFRLEPRGAYRCMRCRQERVTEWRRRVKRRLVAEAGGRCLLCGYDSCPAALQFHHVDPRGKAFALSREGVTRSLAHARAEARKCVLLCANCHAEVEAGYRDLPASVKALAAC
jgi:DNA-binding CsgD family transcriptional regulator